MKRLTAVALLTGSAALMSVSGEGQAQAHRSGADAAPGFNTSATQTDYGYPRGTTPRFIVTFHGARSLDEELRALRGALRSNGADDAELTRLVQNQRGALEADVAMTSRARVDNLRAAVGLDLQWQRSLSTGADLVRFEPKAYGMSIDEFMRKLESNPMIRSVEFDAMMKPLFTPNDTYYSAQWHYYEATAGLNVESAWDTANGSGVTVAVLDTGHRPHVDLIGNIIGGYDFISDSSAARDGNGRDSNPEDEGDWTTGECGPSSNSSWHGTHVSGTIAAVTNNNTGVAGVAYNADILSVRVLGRCGGSLSDIADAIIWASGGSVSGVPNTSTPADVINMSLGGSGSCGSTYQNAINTAVNNGTVVIVAAGNSNTNASGARPANCSNVVTVAASDRQGNRASYSNYGSVVDVTAPGGETATASNGVASTLNSGTTTPGSDNYVYFQGTSMATPHVAGVAALMLDENPALTPAEIESILKSTTRPLAGSCSGGCGAGLVDATAAVAASTGGGGGGGGGGGDGVLDNGETVSNLSGATGAWDYYTIDLPSGATNLSVQMSGGSGDADLYLRFGSQPTTSAYDCRPYLNGNNETCDVASPNAGTYHIGIRAYSSYSGVSLTASFDAPGGGGGGGGSCSVDVDFESGAAGWSNASSSTCSTGAFVLDTPTQRSSSGVRTQVGGDHTTGSGNAVYTATNSSAGRDDVDRGVCVLESPVWSVSSASTLEAWYFHGQRDTGDDGAGDYFLLEMSTNGGSSYSPIVSIGDTRTTAEWTQAAASVPAGSNVKLRLSVSDGTGGGDIIEGGLDDITICN